MKKLLIVLAVLALAVPAGAQIYKNGQAPAAVTTCSDPLPLAQITDSGTANLPLLSGGGAGNPNYALLPVALLARRWRWLVEPVALRRPILTDRLVERWASREARERR